MQVSPYLFFNGNCEQALDFYRDVLGAEIVTKMRYSEAPPDAQMPGVDGNKIMHASFRIGSSDLMASDAGPHEPVGKMDGVSLSVGAPTADEGRKLFDKLAAGGQVTMAYGPQFWTSGFGMCTDKFGVQWMVSADH